MDQVKFQIATGVLPSGAEMMSTRALSMELRLNAMTISKAYAFLEREGVLERRRGQTLIVREHRGAEARAARTEPLRKHLADAATMARQLGVGPDEALKIFRETLEKPKT